MALEMKATSKWWYARLMHKGKARLINLRIEIEGSRPPSITQQGDGKFERSRGRALNEHDRRRAELSATDNAAELVQSLIKIKTGTRVEPTQLSELPDAWERLPHERTPAATHTRSMRKILQRFVSFITEHYADTTELYEVTSPMTKAFLRQEEQRGTSPRTYNVTLSLLRSVFRQLQPEAEAYTRHLASTHGKHEATINRTPFSTEEVDAILAAVEKDDLMRPLITLALCTAMRKGDCCLLQKKDVDLKNGYITVVTAKTSKKVEIPIFPELRRELERLPATRGQYVFPQAAQEYKRNPDGLDQRMKQILARVGFVDGDLARKLQADPDAFLPRLPQETMRLQGLAAITSASMTAKRRASMRKVFELYTEGKTTGDICGALGVSKGTVSGHLHTVEKMIGAQVVRRSATKVAPEVFRGSIHADLEAGRKKKVSIRGWHSFRTTWITVALMHGVPMQLVRRVTGHTSDEIVTDHYFKPGREELRRVLFANMPKMLSNGSSPHEEKPH